MKMSNPVFLSLAELAQSVVRVKVVYFFFFFFPFTSAQINLAKNFAHVNKTLFCFFF